MSPRTLVALCVVADHPQSVAVGDFDGNGQQDLVTANVRSDDLTVLLGNGDGTFAAPFEWAAGAQAPRWLAVADFDVAAFHDRRFVVIVFVGVERLRHRNDSIAGLHQSHGHITNCVFVADSLGSQERALHDSTKRGALLSVFRKICSLPSFMQQRVGESVR